MDKTSGLPNLYALKGFFDFFMFRTAIVTTVATRMHINVKMAISTKPKLWKSAF